MSEKRLWDWLGGVLPPGQFSRVESPDTSPGFPDVHYQLVSGITGTIELKFAHHPEAEIPFKGEKDGLHKSQRIWIRDNIRCGGRVHIIAEVTPLIFIIPGIMASQFNGATYLKLKGISIHVLERKRLKDAARILRLTLLE